MKCSSKRDEFIAACVVASQLHGCFDRLRARITKVDAPGNAAGCDCSQLLGQFDHVLVVEIRAGHVDQTLGLIFDRRNYLRVTMAGGNHCDSSIEIEETVAIHVFNDGALSAARHQRIIARVGGREHITVALH